MIKTNACSFESHHLILHNPRFDSLPLRIQHNVSLFRAYIHQFVSVNSFHGNLRSKLSIKLINNIDFYG